MRNMIYNENDINVFKTVIKKLQLVSAFPANGETYNFLNCIRSWFRVLILGMPLLLGMVGHLYQDVKEKRFFHVIFEAYIFNLLVMFYSIVLILTYRGNRVLQFFEDMSRHKHRLPATYHETMEAVEKRTRIVYYAVCAIIIMLCMESYRNDVFCKSNDIVDDKHYICGSFLPVWYFIDINIPMVKPFFALYSMGMSLYHIPNIACAIVLFYGSVSLIVARIEDLRVFLKKIDFEKDSPEISKSKMIFCVDYYLEICKLVHQMNDTVGYAYAPSQNSNWDVMLGLLGYQATKHFDIIAAFQFLTWITIEGMVCYAGQLLENASSSLREELYDIPWYNMQPPLRSIFKNFQLEIHRTLQLIIKPNLKINLQYFKKVLQGSYSLVMFLKKF